MAVIQRAHTDESMNCRQIVDLFFDVRAARTAHRHIGRHYGTSHDALRPALRRCGARIRVRNRTVNQVPTYWAHTTRWCDAHREAGNSVDSLCAAGEQQRPAPAGRPARR
jgi:hypothetical protein